MGTQLLGWLLGLENVSQIEMESPALAAPWAQENPFWVFLGVVAAAALAVVFYLGYQPRGSRAARIALAVCRGLLLVLLLVTLADPVLRLVVTNIPQPLLFVLVDGTDSMAIADQYSEADQAALTAATGLRPPASSEERPPPTRIDYVAALLERSDDNLLRRLAEEKKYRVEAFVFDGNTTSHLRKLELAPEGSGRVDGAHVAGQLTTTGQVTALGSTLLDVSQQFGAGNVQAVVLVSDFAHNAGAAPMGRRGGLEQSPASRLGVPIHTVGVGAVEAIDLAVDLQTDPKMKRAERTNVQVKLRQTGLDGRQANVRVVARRLSGDRAGAEIVIGERGVALGADSELVDFPFTPEEAGRFEFAVEVEPFEGEVVAENNRASREVTIIDDYLRLMYVANEPDWEWRFIKEVFHRDKLVGMEGFRTYLGSSDPRVRETNILFLSTLTPKRSEFFANDVIFLGDMPGATLSPRFCELVKEYVGVFGGGLVVIAGPRFGPRELLGTPLADMLPVIVDRDARVRDDREFRLQLTPHAGRYPFMRLGESDAENARAWDNLGLVPWYQPVAQLHEQAYALAEHPTDTCNDGKTRQPLIAIRQYGNGEVVYIAQNEMWRLRRKYGEKYYRAFWSQLIYRLGMSHALGGEKRFTARTDRQQYRAEEKVIFTVEAYDENFEPLDEEKLAGKTLRAELLAPGGGDAGRSVALPLLKPGVFEARLPVFTAGEYTLRVQDPVTGQFSESRFEVASVSAERRRGVRDEQLQVDLARETGGRSYDLTTVSRLVDELDLQPSVEVYERHHRLWTTPLWFILAMGLMLGEWFSRKMINLQ